MFIEKYKLSRGMNITVLAIPQRENEKENCPIAVKVTSVMGLPPEAVQDITPFTDLTPSADKREETSRSQPSHQDFGRRGRNDTDSEWALWSLHCL